MAKKKAKPKSGWRSSSILWMIITAISGGGVTGYVNPELPILGPIVKNLVAARASNESAALTGKPEERSDSYTNGRVLTSAQAAPAFAGPALSGTAQPAYSQPTYSQPTYSQPAYSQPTYSSPREGLAGSFQSFPSRGLANKMPEIWIPASAHLA